MKIILIFLLSLVVLISGCATTHRSEILTVNIPKSRRPLKIAVIEFDSLPSNHAEQQRFKYKNKGEWWDRRGTVVTVEDASQILSEKIYQELKKTYHFRGVERFSHLEIAKRTYCDIALTGTLKDFVGINRGCNILYGISLFPPFVVPLFAGFWFSWQTIEAKVKFEVFLIDLSNNEIIWQGEGKSNITTTTKGMRSKKGMEEVILYFLKTDAINNAIADLFNNPELKRVLNSL